MGGDAALKSSGAPLAFSADLKFSGGLPASSRIDVGFAPADDVSGFHLHPSSPGRLLAVSAEEAVQEHCIHQVSSVTAAFATVLLLLLLLLVLLKTRGAPGCQGR